MAVNPKDTAILALIDKALADYSGHSLVDSGAAADVLLDVRQIVAPSAPAFEMVGVLYYDSATDQLTR